MGSRKRILIETLGADLEHNIEIAPWHEDQFGKEDIRIITRPGMSKRFKFWVKENGTRVGQTRNSFPIYKLNIEGLNPAAIKLLTDKGAFIKMPGEGGKILVSTPDGPRWL